jgi:inorganic pyrophosphatase
MESNPDFWEALERLVAASEIIIDRPKGTRHPRYLDILYEVDYGYLKDTSSMDGAGIDVWQGTDSSRLIDAVICTVDLFKRDSEIKILIGCTEEEKQKILYFHNSSETMKGILIRRN